MTLVIDTPNAMEHYRIASAISLLRLAVNTGLKVTRYSLIKACEMNWGCPKKTNAGALAWMENLYEETYGHRYGEA